MHSPLVSQSMNGRTHVDEELTSLDHSRHPKQSGICVSFCNLFSVRGRTVACQSRASQAEGGFGVEDIGRREVLP